MAHADPIGLSALQDIALQVGDRLSTFRPDAENVSIRETFRLWILPPADLREASWRDVDLTELAVRTDRWHHQLRDAESVFGFARSVGEPGERWLLHEIFESPIANFIDAAIERIDNVSLGGDPLVQLVYAPAFQLYALWLVDENQAGSQALVAYAPEQFNVPRNEIGPSWSLLRNLSREVPIVGVNG